MNINVNKICKKPFIYCEIQPDGNVYPCCPAYCGYYSFGNIYESTLEEIWNNEKARTFRNNILNHNYKYCDLKYCMAYNAFSEHEALPDVNTKIYPQILAVSCDRECNVACITCRDSIIRNNKEDEERLEKFTNNIWSVLPKIKYFYISGSGDPFGKQIRTKLNKNCFFIICRY